MADSASSIGQGLFDWRTAPQPSGSRSLGLKLWEKPPSFAPPQLCGLGEVHSDLSFPPQKVASVVPVKIPAQGSSLPTWSGPVGVSLCVGWGIAVPLTYHPTSRRWRSGALCRAMASAQRVWEQVSGPRTLSRVGPKPSGREPLSSKAQRRVNQARRRREGEGEGQGKSS